MIGMTTAIVSMNAVESHCAATASMRRSSISRGMATDMIVSLRITTNVAESRSQITRLFRLVWSGGAGTAGAASAADPATVRSSDAGSASASGAVFSVTRSTVSIGTDIGGDARANVAGSSLSA